MRIASSWWLCAAAAMALWQEPQQQPRPDPGQDPVKVQTRQPAQPAAVPAGEAASGAALGRPERHRFEGVYRLTGAVRAGVADPTPARGYLAITGRHLMLVVATASGDPDTPLVSAGVRRWQESQGTVRTVVELDFHNDTDGELHFAPEGLAEVRTIELVRGGLRLRQSAQSWLSFERLE